MRAPISVIVPTLNSEAVLGPCLQALMPGLEAGLIRELIVSDGGSEDATVRLAKAWGAEVVEGPASRGGQLRRGCEAAQGHWLLVLHADTILAPGWVEPVIAHLGRHDAGWFRLAFAAGGWRGRAVALWANLRSRLGLPYGDQGLLVPMPLYRKVGGYADQPLMEDVAIARALRGHLRPIDAVALTSAQKYRKMGWLRRGARNLWTLARYAGGASPERLAQDYYR
ncbi:TIGR04283 family arsenosugar biosynthesis glycosyltransferase [Sulfitobacter sp. D35]|uniref:TIGR04283 family arsenosugar biosynthesis glycosyltransferase n=1 Tax=Sulfitobacter sp. D35 TaxID=3083252 RepID=UPI00296F2224|nr:TIGR04283 family arsenosugar biosynthesis glycosyltransferase [Sulfitobacter sp. D35]MDW4497063.1 TIGR04283 family arsenosugar biosynthesis glycosyltransferase [Sulfitobacter sp. D35]